MSPGAPCCGRTRDRTVLPNCCAPRFRQLALVITAMIARDFAIRFQNDSSSRRVVVFVQAGVAISVLGLAWCHHGWVQPYDYAFQNWVEHWLFAANIIVIVLGTVYTILGLTIDQKLSTLRRLVEGCMFAVLVSSLAVTATYLTWRYRRGGVQHTQVEHNQLQRERRATRGRKSCGKVGIDQEAGRVSTVPPDAGRLSTVVPRAVPSDREETWAADELFDAYSGDDRGRRSIVARRSTLTWDHI